MSIWVKNPFFGPQVPYLSTFLETFVKSPLCASSWGWAGCRLPPACGSAARGRLLLAGLAPVGLAAVAVTWAHLYWGSRAGAEAGLDVRRGASRIPVGGGRVVLGTRTAEAPAHSQPQGPLGSEEETFGSQADVDERGLCR